MNLCEDHGDDMVIYKGRECPFCICISDLEEAKDKIEELQEGGQ